MEYVNGLMDYISPRSWAVGLLTIITSGGMYFFHYIPDFIYIRQIQGENWYIFLHLISLTLGSLIFLAFLRNKDVFILEIVFGILSMVCMAIPTVFKEFTIIMFVLTGISVGITMICMIVLLSEIKSIPRKGGNFGVGNSAISLIIIFGSVLTLLLRNFGFLLFYGIVIICFSILIFFKPTEYLDNLVAIDLSPTLVLKQKENYSALLVVFFQGLFFTTTYYATKIILEANFPNEDIWIYSVIILFAFTALISPLMGLLMDKLGRKPIFLMGIYLQGTTVVLASFLNLNPLNVYIILLTLSMGAIGGVFLPFLYIGEVAPQIGLKSFVALSAIAFSFGMTMGVFLSEVSVVESLILILLFVSLTFTLVVFQIKETLPSKSERMWMNKLEELLVISKSGLPLFYYSFTDKQKDIDSALKSGALTGLMQIVPEITEKKSNLRVIEQENFCVMFESIPDVTLALMSQEDLTIIRDKMKIFLGEFELFFGKLIREWNGNQVVFSPALRIVEKVFL